MGAGKDAPPPPTGEPPQPVVLKMELHCAGCAKKVRKAIHRMPGVVSVVADPAANTVVVAGTADAAALKERIESKTKKPVQIVSGGGYGKPPPPAAAETKKTNPDKQGGGGEEKKNPDKGGGGGDKGDKAGASSHPKEAGKQPPEEKKPEQATATTAVLRIRLHCDGCADRIRRRIYKIKGVKDVAIDGGHAKDEVRVVGTMDVPAMLAYLNEKLNRTVELAAAASPGSKGGEDKKKDKSGGDGAGHVKADKAADKGKGVEVAGPSVASAAAMAPAPPGASTHHVSPYGYGNVAYPYPAPAPQQGPPPGYYNGGNEDYGSAGYGYGGGYYQQERSADAGSYYQQQPSAGGYYQQPSAGGYYQQHQSGSGYEQHHGSNPAPPYQAAYPFDTAPAPQMFSDENPNACNLM